MEGREKLEKTATRIAHAALSVLIVGAGLFIASQDISYERFRTLGYLGIFLGTAIGSSTVLLPAPNIAILVSGGLWLRPTLVGLVGGVGWGLGEITGFLVGRHGALAAFSSPRNRERLARFTTLLQRRGILLIFLFALVPNPVFDFVGVGAGMIGIRLWKFVVACVVARVISGILIAHLGHLAPAWIRSL